MLKNPEVKKELLILSALCAAACVFGAVWDKKCFVTALITGAVFLCAYLFMTHIHYKRIAALSRRVDGALHSDGISDISGFCEGELSVLENELQKLLIKYKEQNGRLTAEKIKLSDSLADISHQLRTPLTSINILLTLLSVPELEQARRFELTGELSSLLNSTEQLIDLLLKIARLDAGADRLEQKEISVEDCVQRALKLFAAPLEIKELSVDTSFNGECFTGDMRWTAEALANVIKNCIEHTPPGGRISICACETPIYTEITVSDSGSGFDEEDIAHLFERFYKGKSSDSSGFGIGLSLANVVIKRQNGTIRAYNSGTGACFEIKFYKEVI